MEKLFNPKGNLTIKYYQLEILMNVNFSPDKS